MKERILEFLAYLSVGQHKFEKKAGLSIGYINKLKGDMKLDTINKIISTYPELNKEWLITGEGEMLRSSASDTVTPATSASPDSPKQEKNKIIKNPMTTDDRIDALIRQNDALSETNLALTKALQDAVKASQDAIKASQDAIKMTHDTIAANQRQGETNQEIMKQLLSILENSKKNSHAGVVPDVALRVGHG